MNIYKVCDMNEIGNEVVFFVIEKRDRLRGWLYG